MDRKLTIALTLYVTALFASNTLGIKLMPFLFGTHLSAAIFVFPIVFLMTDVVGEVFGREQAKRFVRMGTISLVFFLTFNLLANVLPSSPDFSQRESFEEIFGLTFRFALASLVAYVVGEYQDVFSFFFLKAKLGGRWFWLRSNLSNLWGQFLDTVLWSTIAFAGVYSFGTIVEIIIPWWLFKSAMGAVYTPLSYLGIKLLRGNARPGDSNATIS
ncbi:MAG: queuosine precursor transporter [Candidatus Kerfeldbacteria bacterium]|nr:queuosine precursor transporter [Candidatus Kerfeldbacteria bacterium]